MSWQDSAETISVGSLALTQAYSVEALADAGSGTSVSAPSSSVISLDGKVLKLIVAGTVASGSTGHIQVSGSDFATVPNSGGSTQGFFAEFDMCWMSSLNKLFFSNSQTSPVSGLSSVSSFSVNYSSASAVSISSQTDLSFSVSNITLTQLTLKLV